MQRTRSKKIEPQEAVFAQAEDVIDVAPENFAQTCASAVNESKWPLSLMYATDERTAEGAFYVHAVFSIDAEARRVTYRTRLSAEHPSYPSVTRLLMAAHWYERLMFDQFGIVAEGHPDWRRIMHHENVPAGTFPLRKDFAWNTQLEHANEPYPMHQVTGDGVYEIPVGPIHAGIIEPGHFRFNVMGERILTLEGKLFFKHKGTEKIIEGKNPEEALPFVERVSGDAAVSHALAFCQAVESAANAEVPARAQYLRTVACEIERMTMHLFDIGNIAGNGTGFTFMAAQGFRLVERMRRLQDRIFGHRFSRGFVVPGGCARDLDGEEIGLILKEIEAVSKDAQKIFAIALGTDGLMERFETTGILKHAAAVAYGALGVAARASGINRDARRDFPHAAYGAVQFQVPVQESGDVRARFEQRIGEFKASATIISKLLSDIQAGPVRIDLEPGDGSAYGCTEGWRGETLYWVRLKEGVIDRCVIRDPSFCNWPLFGELGPGNIVPDFPLCNKSLNLSYSGCDL